MHPSTSELPISPVSFMSPFHIPVVTGITQALGEGPGGQSAHNQFSGLRFPLSSARRLCRDGTIRVLPKIGYIKKKKKTLPVLYFETQPFIHSLLLN